MVGPGDLQVVDFGAHLRCGGLGQPATPEHLMGIAP